MGSISDVKNGHRNLRRIVIGRAALQGYGQITAK